MTFQLVFLVYHYTTLWWLYITLTVAKNTFKFSALCIRMSLARTLTYHLFSGKYAATVVYHIVSFQWVIEIVNIHMPYFQLSYKNRSNYDDSFSQLIQYNRKNAHISNYSVLSNTWNLHNFIVNTKILFYCQHICDFFPHFPNFVRFAYSHGFESNEGRITIIECTHRSNLCRL